MEPARKKAKVTGGFEDLKMGLGLEAEAKDLLVRIHQLEEKNLLDRIKQVVQTTTNDASSNEDPAGFVVGHNNKEEEIPTKPTFNYIPKLPPKEMTSVSPFMLRLCATISANTYNDESLDDPTKAPEDQYTDICKGYTLKETGFKAFPNVILSHNHHKIIKATNPPVVIVVVDSTMILGWRGSANFMDAVADLGFFVSSSYRWSKVAKVVKVQGSFMALLEEFMIENEKFILQAIEDYDITEIILTGHSLGGGVAQVAHLWLEGSMTQQDDTVVTSNPWKKLDGKLTIRTIAFESPMTTAYLPLPLDDVKNVAVNEAGKAFIHKCGINMCTTCFSFDVIPRFYGRPEFAFNIINDIVTSYENNPPKLFHLLKRPEWVIAKNILKWLTKKGTIPFESWTKKYVPVARLFQHIGKIIYYEDNEASPVVYVDDHDSGNGLDLEKLFTEKGEGSSFDLLLVPPPQLGSIKYVSPSKKMKGNPLADGVNAIQAAYHHHLFPICGPGFSLSWQPFFEKHQKL